MPDYALTPQQEAILAAAAEKSSFKVAALAGTAKTSTLRDVTESLPDRKFIYLAYNTATSEEAKAKFPRNVTVKTGHALAFRHVGYRFKARLTTNGWEMRKAVEDMLKSDLSLASMNNNAQYNRYLLAVMDALTNFQHSADREIAEQHMPEVYQQYCNPLLVATLARKAWEQMSDERASCPVSHDVYLKIFELSDKRLDAEAILLDEMQDSNPVILSILAKQNHAQIIGVGDSNQAIYAWRHAVDAIDTFPYPSFPLTKSWRFGSKIARIANTVLQAKGSELFLEGGAPDGRVVEWSDQLPTAVVTRTNAGLVNEVLDLLGRQVSEAGGKRDVRVSVLGGVEVVVNQIRGAFELYERGRSTHPNFRIFSSFAELCEAAQTSQSGSLRPFVTLVERHKWNVPAICDRLQRETVTPDRADVIVSTCHKFKGAESDRVRLGADFPQFAIADEDGKIHFRVEEANLAYVALTRARTELQVGPYRPVLAESLRLSNVLREGGTHDPRVSRVPDAASA